MIRDLAMLLGPLAAVYMFLYAAQRLTQDPKEPPVLGDSIPFVRTIIGMASGFQDFVVKLRDDYNYPIYTLRLPGSRMYIINSVPLVQAVQRQHKTLSFNPIKTKSATHLLQVSPAAAAILEHRMMEHDSYSSTFLRSIHPAVSPGVKLEAFKADAILNIANSMAEICAGGPTTVDLFHLVRHEMFRATTDSVYGPKSPFHDPKLEQAWDDFEPGVIPMLMGLLPGLTARKSVQARDKQLVPAFEKYFGSGGLDEASPLVKARHQHNAEHNIVGRDVAALEVGGMVAALSNSIPTAFWLVYRVFSDPRILEECRREADQLIEVDEAGVRNVDLVKVASECPVLYSTWQEVLRHENISSSVRVVMEDTLLDGKYLLKKGNVAMMLMPVLHTDVDSWGETAREFNHHRFLDETKSGNVLKRKNPPAFRAFGGGSVICPGRHFVTAEVMNLALVMLLRFDMKPKFNDKGTWEEPRKQKPMVAALPSPKDAVSVELIPRDGEKWRFEYTISDQNMPLVEADVTK